MFLYPSVRNLCILFSLLGCAFSCGFSTSSHLLYSAVGSAWVCLALCCACYLLILSSSPPLYRTFTARPCLVTGETLLPFLRGAK